MSWNKILKLEVMVKLTVDNMIYQQLCISRSIRLGLLRYQKHCGQVLTVLMMQFETKAGCRVFMLQQPQRSRQSSPQLQLNRHSKKPS